MKKPGVRTQRWLKAFHVLFAGIWLGATLTAVTIIFGARDAMDAATLQGAYAVAVNIGKLVIPFSSVLTLLTGILVCWLTSWGFFKYWSVVLQIIAWSAVFTIAITSLDPALETSRALAGANGLSARQNVEFIVASETALRLGITNVLIISFATFVAVIKPWGRTKWGRSLDPVLRPLR
jgi:hypothetical protein